METAKNYEKNSKIFIELREILSKLSSCPFYESILVLINRKKENPDAESGRMQMEHPAGIEPVYSAWEADVLPLN